MPTIAIRVPFFAAVFLVCAFSVRAQEPAPPQATTTANPGIAIDELELRLRPLEKDELEVEAGAWKDLLKTNVGQIVEQEVALKADGLTDAARSGIEQTLTQLRSARGQLVERLNAVLTAWTSKGGDAVALEQYVSSVAGLAADVDIKDPNRLLSLATDWAQDKDGGIKWALNIVWFVLTLFAFSILARIGAALARKAVGSQKLKMSDLLRNFVVNTVRNIIRVLGVVIAISMLGVNIGPFLAAIGVVGFVIGFALQESLNNFAAGFMILLYRPYDVGDVVTAGGSTGKVKAMNLVSTTLGTPDNQTVIVPNGKIWGDVITNVTGQDTRRVDLVFGIGYDDDMAKAQAILDEVVAAHPKVHKDPAPVIKVHELADSSVNFVCRPWTATSDYWDVYWDLTRTVKERFDAEGISIPYPQQDVHMHQVSG